MNQVHQEEIKSFEQLRERVKRLVERYGRPVSPEAHNMVREFLPEENLSEKEKTGGD